MRVFVTGATGFVGSAIVQELLGAGHQVVGLTRSDTGAAALEQAGAQVYRGNLDEPDSLVAGAAGADAVIHTAFDHDFSRFADNCEKDRRAIAALGKGLMGSERRLIVTSGLAQLAAGRLATEHDVPPAGFPRQSEAAAAALRAQGVRAAAMRLPPSVHGAGDHGFVPMLIALARRTGVSAYVGDGGNPWAATHRLDVAHAFRLALERGGSGPWHAVAEEAIPFAAIAGAIGKGLGVPVRSLSNEEAAAHFGWMAHFVAGEMAASSARTRTELGWAAAQAGLLADLEQGMYFSGHA
ncbi:nucleoside-diphosphate-sugar epimerase [Pseudoduganella flava]|uniref:NAD-dependent epimerase/dehydratase family protein n=1 Tax=Pseudoduganella flava TaxID=871742 RepID=A0A562PT58_9BURK|nr:SDR family oxidoreductase [Pseudoduganella flava]QGZ39349.1 NAD-dependent epimerase/dehydratase family protein [Pseudoduganella flava]TWI47340.1 nucleoside-diphosphate-sugar epimerase [Pseudoduganella flava]